MNYFINGRIHHQDSPWYENRELMDEKEKNAVETLIKISDEGISSQWCGEHIVFNDLS